MGFPIFFQIHGIFLTSQVGFVRNKMVKTKNKNVVIKNGSIVFNYITT